MNNIDIVKNKRQRQRACDHCRKKKTKCDGPERSSQGLKCSNCENALIECTYVEQAPKKVGSNHHIESLKKRNIQLEQRLNELENLLENSKISSTGNSNSFSDHHSSDEEASNDIDNSKRKRQFPFNHQINFDEITNKTDNEEEDELDNYYDEQEKKQWDLMVSMDEKECRYFGRASSVGLFTRASEFALSNILDKSNNNFKRPQFWQHMEPSINETSFTNDDYPPDDLLYSLINLYFDRVNFFLPLINKDVFMDNLKHKKYDRHFGGLLLLVLAVASRFSDDPRVLSSNSDAYLQPGERFFNSCMTKTDCKIMEAPTIEDIQMLVLIQAYIKYTAHGKNCWNLNGAAVIQALDIGLNMDSSKWFSNPVNSETRNRVFYCLFVMDRSMSSLYGRPCVINENSIFIDLPSILPQEQGTKTESSIRFFDEIIKLYKVQGDVVNMTLSFNKKKSNDNVGRKAKSYLMDVASLNSKLNCWHENIHPSLRYDENCQDSHLFRLKAILKIGFHCLQINIYRCFVPIPTSKPNNFRVTSLIICANASRSILKTWDKILEKNIVVDFYVDIMFKTSVFTAVIVLVISTCEARKNSDDSYLSDLKYIQDGMRIIKNQESNDFFSGKIYDMVHGLIHACKLDVYDAEQQQQQLSQLQPPSLNYNLDNTHNPLPITYDTQLIASGNTLDQNWSQEGEMYNDMLKMVTDDNFGNSYPSSNDSSSSPFGDTFSFTMPLTDNTIDEEWSNFLTNIFHQNVY